MSKPDPAITADLLSKLPTRKGDLPKSAGLPGMKDHAGKPQPLVPKMNPRTAEKSSGPGRTRTSNRGK